MILGKRNEKELKTSLDEDDQFTFMVMQNKYSEEIRIVFWDRVNRCELDSIAFETMISMSEFERKFREYKALLKHLFE